MLFWNKRLWLLGLLLGNFAGLLLLFSGNPTTRRFLEIAFPYTAFGYYTGDFVLMLVFGGCIRALFALAACQRDDNTRFVCHDNFPNSKG